MTNAEFNERVAKVNAAVDQLNQALREANASGLGFRFVEHLHLGCLDEVFLMNVDFRQQPKEDSDGK